MTDDMRTMRIRGRECDGCGQPFLFAGDDVPVRCSDCRTGDRDADGRQIGIDGWS